MINHKKEIIRMKNKVPMIVLVVIALGGFLWYMKGSMPTQPVQPSESMQPASGNAVTDANTKALTVDGSEFKFNMTSITLKKGEKVKLTLTNSGNMPHDFVVDELGIRTKIIKNGETDTIEFTPDKTGSFEFYCSVGSHRAKGMKGTMIVE